jgi:hypothetical protein
MEQIRAAAASKGAFLQLGEERKKLVARLHHADRRRRDRYRDLVLVTQIICLEYEQLVGRGGRRAPASPTGELTALEGDAPMAWSQPWGSGAMFDLRTSFANFRDRRDRLGRWMPAPTRARAAADAKSHLEQMRVSGGFDEVIEGRRLELAQGRVSAPRTEPRNDQEVAAAGDGEIAVKEARPWSKLVLARTAAIAAVVLLIAGVDAAIHSGGGPGSASSPSRISAKLPERPLEPLGLASVESQRERAKKSQRAHRRAKAAERQRGNSSGARTVSQEQAAPAVSQAPPAATQPATSPTPTPTATAVPVTSAPAPAPAPTPAPAPAPTPAPAPAPTSPQQEFGFEN